MRLKFISPCNEVACLPKRSEALYIYIYMYTRSKAVRNTFLRYHFPIDRSFNSFRVSTESTDAGGKGKKHIISVSKPMDRRNGVTSRWTAVNPWLGNERSRAFVESNAHITYPLSSLLFQHDDLQTYYPLLLLFFSSFDEEKKGDTLEIFSNNSLLSSRNAYYYCFRSLWVN